MSLHGDHEGGAAKRRRDRRLRMHWRHEQLTLQKALAAALHHSRDVGPVTYNALRSQTTSVAGDTEFFSLYEEELGGTRPDRLYEVRTQERVQRRTVEQIVDNTLFLPTLDVPVPQMENQLVEASRCPHSRAGYRSAQNLLFPSISQAPCAFRGADGRTVGGSADDRFLLLVARACGAEPGHSSSSWS